MRTTKEDIRRWLEEAKEEKAAYMIVMCDTFSWEDYSVSVPKGKDIIEELEERHQKNMQKAMEVYDMSKDIELQIKEHRAGIKYIKEVEEKRRKALESEK